MYYNSEHKQMVENRGDEYTYIGSYKSKEITIDGKGGKGDRSFIRVKCLYCGEKYDIAYSGFKNKRYKCTHCCNKYENSFAYHIEVELGAKLEDYWDFEENGRLGINPYLIYKNTKKIKVWIWCQDKWYHGSYDISPDKFTGGGDRCSYCNPFASHRNHPKDSFAQWGIDTFGDNFLEKYWSEKNTLNPWKISPNSGKYKIWILCQEKDYHNDNGGYLLTPNDFYQGRRCPYCNRNGGKVHLLDSFGILYPEKIKYWNYEKNKTKKRKTPFEVAPYSNLEKYWWICQNCGSFFERSLSHINQCDSGVYCIDCNNSQLEEITKRILQKYNIEYKSQVKYDGLIGLGNGNLSYDFYLPNYNLLIECQGEQHEHYCKGFHKNKADFERQLEHDRRKKQYAIDHNINFLEIWYYDIDNIEKILIKQLNL